MAAFARPSFHYAVTLHVWIWVRLSYAGSNARRSTELASRVRYPSGMVNTPTGPDDLWL